MVGWRAVTQAKGKGRSNAAVTTQEQAETCEGLLTALEASEGRVLIGAEHAPEESAAVLCLGEFLDDTL